MEFQRKRTGPINLLISDDPVPLINPRLANAFKLNLYPGQGKNNYDGEVQTQEAPSPTKAEKSEDNDFTFDKGVGTEGFKEVESPANISKIFKSLDQDMNRIRYIADGRPIDSSDQ